MFLSLADPPWRGDENHVFAFEAHPSHLIDREPLDWASTQDNLGYSLAMLGERENNTARLEEAVAACRAMAGSAR